MSRVGARRALSPLRCPLSLEPGTSSGPARGGPGCHFLQTHHPCHLYLASLEPHCPLLMPASMVGAARTRALPLPCPATLAEPLPRYRVQVWLGRWSPERRRESWPLAGFSVCVRVAGQDRPPGPRSSGKALEGVQGSVCSRTPLARGLEDRDQGSQCISGCPLLPPKSSGPQGPAASICCLSVHIF